VDFARPGVQAVTKENALRKSADFAPKVVAKADSDRGSAGRSEEEGGGKKKWVWRAQATNPREIAFQVLYVLVSMYMPYAYSYICVYICMYI